MSLSKEQIEALSPDQKKDLIKSLQADLNNPTGKVDQGLVAFAKKKNEAAKTSEEQTKNVIITNHR